MLCIFFFKQKTGYELRISDWSSDVCSSDLLRGFVRKISKRRHQIRQMPAQRGKLVVAGDAEPHDRHPLRRRDDDILPLMADAGEEVVRAAIGRSEERRVGKSVAGRFALGGRRIIYIKN